MMKVVCAKPLSWFHCARICVEIDGGTYSGLTQTCGVDVLIFTTVA